jgi:putative MATE family efflux protein
MTSFLARLRGARRRPAPGDPNPLLEGPVRGTLLGLSIPMILAMLVVTGFGLVDMMYLGRYSKEAMAAIQLAFPVSYLLMALAGGLGTAATSLGSRLLGAGEERRARNLVLHVLAAVAGLTLVVTPLGLLLLREALAPMHAEPAVLAGALTYARISYGGAFFALFPQAASSLFRGEGDTVTPFRILALALLVNIVLAPLLIFGPGPFPELGVAGAAWATVASFAVASLLVLRELASPRRRMRLDRSAWRWDPALLRGLGAVGGPAFLANLATPLSVELINRQLTPFGTDALAAFGVGSRLLNFVFLPTVGISLSMLIMVGQNHGAGRRDRVRSITWTTVGVAVIMMAALAVPVLLLPRRALGAFTDQQAIIALAVPFVLWVIPARPMLSVVNITAYWFQARGQGPAGMAPNFLMRVILEPLGVFVGLRVAHALLGAWIGMCAGNVVGGLACLALLAWRLRVYTAAGAAPAAVTAPPAAS